jgi:hypothetical protein
MSVNDIWFLTMLLYLQKFHLSYMFMEYLFNDTFQTSECMMLNGIMLLNDELGIDEERSDCLI